MYSDILAGSTFGIGKQNELASQMTVWIISKLTVAIILYYTCVHR